MKPKPPPPGPKESKSEQKKDSSAVGATSVAARTAAVANSEGTTAG